MIVVGVIIIIFRVAVDELQVLQVVCETREHLCGIKAVILGFHHLRQTGKHLILAIDG